MCASKKLTKQEEAYCKILANFPPRPPLKVKKQAIIESGFKIKHDEALTKKAKELTESVSIVSRIEQLRDDKPFGRPTKYHPKYCEEIVNFFNREPHKPLMVKNDKGKDVVATDKYGRPIFTPCRLPTKEAFAASIGIHTETLINWAKANPDFFDAVKKAENLQKEILVQNGLTGNYEKTFAIFTAKNVTDMSDKQTVDNISSDGSMSPKKDFNDFYSDDE